MGTWDEGEGIVEFPDGRRVRGRRLRRAVVGDPPPEFGVYLAGRDPRVAGWSCRWVRWRDFGLPASTDDAVTTLREAYLRMESERVEVACAGGIGRTGTALAALAVMSGVDADSAVVWVREHYHRRAVETRRQQRWVVDVATLIGR